MVGVMLDCATSPCRGLPSSLVPAGTEAERVATLFDGLLIGGALVWVLVIGLAVYAARVNPAGHSERAARRIIVWGGIALPTLVLAGLLVHALGLLGELRAPADGLRIAVSGERFWWRVRYAPDAPMQDWQATFIDPADGAQGTGVDTANALHLPVGERSELLLYSPDVIHSLWIPALAGKIDMIPGRVNRLVLEPTRVGTYRGVCAEFCGAAHALMAFTVTVSPRAEFERWLAGQARPASVDAADPGYRAFLANGCGACHRVRGTPADGRVGPDLTHVGSRLTLGAGTLATDAAGFARVIRAPAHVKPGIRMPAYDMLPDAEIRAMAAWLAGLK